MRARTRRPRLGFLGVGWIGRNRLEAVARSGVADIAAIVDPMADCREAARSLAPGAVLASSFEELVGQPAGPPAGQPLGQPLDGVVIATPSALHAEQAIAALERGLAVFCQKPLARNAAETARVIAAARDADRLLGVDLSYRHTAAMARIRGLIHAGAIGRVHAADLVFHNAYGPDKPWFYERALSGGGCVMDLGIHLVDLLLWTLTPPRPGDDAGHDGARAARNGARVSGPPRVVGMHSRLSARGRPIVGAGGDQVEDFAAVQIELDSGVTAQLRCSWRLSAGRDAVIEASFYGTEGGASMRNINGSFYDFCAEHYQGTSRTVLVEPPDDWGGRAVVAWAEKLARGARFDREAEHLVDTAAAIDTIYVCASKHHA